MSDVRLIECDTKSLSCLSVAGTKSQSGSGHSRTPSIASQISVQSGNETRPVTFANSETFNAYAGSSQECGEASGGGESDLWLTWSDILKNWDKRKTGNIKVRGRVN